MIFISFIGLCASLVGPSDDHAPKNVVSFLALIENLNEDQFAEQVRSRHFKEALPVDLIKEIESSVFSMALVSEQFEDLGVSNTTLRFFTLGPNFAGLSSAVERLSTKPLPPKLLDWTSESLSDLVTLSNVGQDIEAVKPIDLTVQLSNSNVLERYTNAGADLEAILLFAANLGDVEYFNPPRERLVAAAQALKRDLERLRQLPPPISSEKVSQIVELVRIVEEWDIVSLQTARERALASATAASLKSGSISAAGFTIPGVVINLLLPLLAFGLSVDLLLTLRRASVWVERYMQVDDVSRHLELFPWIPILVVTAQGSDDPDKKFLSAIAVIIHFSPPLALCYMVLTEGNVIVVTLVAMLSVFGTAAALILSLHVMLQMRSKGRQSAEFEQNLPDPMIDLMKIHLDRIDVAWTTVMTVSGIVSIFFIAFLFVPAALLGDRTDLARAKMTRSALEAVYEQRLKEHRDTYLAWSENVDDTFHELIFLSANLPDEHPAYQLAEQMLERPPLDTYPSAKSNLDDIVKEERADLAALDLYDLSDLTEILYRNDMDDLSGLLEEVRDSLARTPLPDDAMENLPSFVNPQQIQVKDGTVGRPLYGSVSTTNPGGAKISIPLPIPYRVEVEKAGFAYRLTELPARDDVEHFTEFLESNSIAKVAGFDGYERAFRSFDTQLGTLKLQVFGVEIDRVLANEVSVSILLVLQGLLLLRLVVATQIFCTIDDPKSLATLLASTNISFLHGTGGRRTLGLDVTGLALLAFPLCVLALVEWSSWGGQPRFSWSTIGCLLGVLLSFLIFMERRKLRRLGIR